MQRASGSTGLPVSVGLPASAGNIFDVPFELRANDIVRHIINIDSRFRDSPALSSSTNFYYSLLSPVRNVLRVRITSIEFPNNYPIFTAARQNVSFRVLYLVAGNPATYVVVIPEGNYTAGDMETAINAALVEGGLTWLSVVFNPITGGFTFTAAGAGAGYFAIDTTWDSYDRPFDYGLGYFLGFTRGLHRSDTVAPFVVVSDQCAHFAGDNYLFLRVNDWACVRQTVGDNDFTAMAKIVLREPKDHMAFDDYASQHAKEVTFPNPTDLTRFKVQLLDPYGELMDLCSSQFSFSVEVLEVKNPALYNMIRDSLAIRYA
jgi:hypothetical protein